MKLFEVSYIEDCDPNSYLTVGKDEYEVFCRESERLSEELDCFMGCSVNEVLHVDEFEVKLIKREMKLKS